jgi:hypothetical protein
VESALESELTDQRGYDKYEVAAATAATPATAAAQERRSPRVGGPGAQDQRSDLAITDP